MDSVSLVVSALTAGAQADRIGAAEPAVKDTYDRLKLLVFPVVVTIAEYEKDPEAWQVPLTRVLLDSNAADHPELVETANKLLALLGPMLPQDASPNRDRL